MDYEILGKKIGDFLKTYDKAKLEEWIRFDEERTLRERRMELKEKIVNKIYKISTHEKKKHTFFNLFFSIVFKNKSTIPKRMWHPFLIS
ncbi:MAG: hypothetical protein WCG45_01050 [bacterium]